MSGAGRALAALLCLGPVLAGLCAGDPGSWVPARWDGGPLEVARRAKDKVLVADAALREAIAKWYDPATLSLLEGTLINCLLVTFSGPAGSEQEGQHQLVRAYAEAARGRGIAVLGIVYPGADPAATAMAAAQARLDGLVLEGDFGAGAGYVEQLERTLRARNSPALVIPIAHDAAAVRTAQAPLLAVEGVRPSARDLADMGIRAGPSAEPWIESNIWLVRSFRLGMAWRPVWINQGPNPYSLGDYVRCVADAAVAGGRWIVGLDDSLRTKLFRKDADALATWRRVGAYLKFAEDHAEWRSFVPYGNLGIILDTASPYPDVSNEYLNLVARRQVPYRLIQRSQLSAGSLAGFQALLAADLAGATEAERNLLRAFAEKGGLVVAGPSWGDAPKDQPYAEVPLGKGRVAVYKEDPPDPESVARDLLDLLEPEVMGLNPFNVPSALTYASMSDSGKRVLVQLLNYASSPFNSRITIRINGGFKSARLHTPENAPVDLAVRAIANGGRTEFVVPKLVVWGAVLLE
jgi:hypothetical protein